jgi:hypothetical protein
MKLISTQFTTSLFKFTLCALLLQSSSYAQLQLPVFSSEDIDEELCLECDYEVGERIVPVHIGLTYPISTNWVIAAEISNNVSIHALVGMSHSEYGFACAGIGNVIKYKQDGVAVAGVFNTVADSAKGVQVAGLTNITTNIDGAQIAGLNNIAKQNANIQIAGLLNQAHNNNVQVAGFMNVAKETNTQIGGFLNIAKTVKGVQIAGFINIAEDCDYPIGLINIIKNGYKSIGAFVDESGNALISFRSGGKKTYGIIGIGYNYLLGEEAPITFEAGLGIKLPLYKWMNFNLEVSQTLNSDMYSVIYSKGSVRGLLELSAGKKVSFAFGPSINYHNSNQFNGEHYDWPLFNYDNYINLYSINVGGVAGIIYKF